MTVSCHQMWATIIFIVMWHCMIVLLIAVKILVIYHLFITFYWISLLPASHSMGWLYSLPFLNVWLFYVQLDFFGSKATSWHEIFHVATSVSWVCVSSPLCRWCLEGPVSKCSDPKAGGGRNLCLLESRLIIVIISYGKLEDLWSVTAPIQRCKSQGVVPIGPL